MTKRNRKGLLNALFLISIFLLTVWAVFKGEDLHQIGQALTMANPWWILPGIACVVLFIIGESAVIKHAIIGEGCCIGVNCRVGDHPEFYSKSEWGIAVVGNGKTIEKNSVVNPKEIV